MTRIVKMKHILMIGFMGFIFCKNNVATKDRSYLLYQDSCTFFYFDATDSLDGFVMYPSTLSVKQKVSSSTIILSDTLIFGVGAFGIKFGDSFTQVKQVLGEPTTIKTLSDIIEQPQSIVDQSHDLQQTMLLVYQNGDSCILVNIYNDSVNKFTDYLVPVKLPSGLWWRMKKDSLIKIMGKCDFQGQFKMPSSIRF